MEVDCIEFKIIDHTLIFPAKGMNLQATLFCGQSFVWNCIEGEKYIGVAANFCTIVSQQEDSLFFEKPDSSSFSQEEIDFWWRYFALDMDYPALLEKFCQNKKLCACVEYAPGIRVLRQPFWDTLLSFIISQNNHITRITGIVQRLKSGYGTCLFKDQYSFPSADFLATLSVEDLADLRAGFRAKYLLDAAQKVASGQVDELILRNFSDEDARKCLTTIVGVGTKVADCVLLYSLARNRVVPMDVWMKRAMAQVFPKGMPRVARGYEGIAQQYIFCWAREYLK